MGCDTPTICTMHTAFINAMVSAMYAWEAAMTADPNLVTDQEATNFYMAYMSIPK